MPRPAAWVLTPGRTPYRPAYDAMHQLADRRAEDEIPDTLILLEHPPVFTAGKRWDPGHLLFDEPSLERIGAELHHVDRGGSVTFHGPGQLVGYPIVHLGPEPDVIAHLRNVEEVIIRACADLGVAAARSDGYTGVWAGEQKVCAIGVRVQRAVTLHGFALNCATDVAWFGAIVPCGIPDRGVTTLSELTGREVTVDEALPVVARRFAEVFDRTLRPAPPEIVQAFASDAQPAAAGG
jgi:lipoyl(octanoyl) transferase